MTFKLIYLLILSTGLFFTKSVIVISTLLFLQLVLWLYSRIDLSLLIHLIRRIIVMFAIITLSYSFFEQANAEHNVIDILQLNGWNLSLSLTGLYIGLLMVSKILIIVMASLWVRESSSQNQFIQGLKKLYLPEIIILSVDAILASTAGQRQQRNKKQGKRGSGKNKIRLLFSQIRQGNIQSLQDYIEKHFQSSSTYLSKLYPDMDKHYLRDLAIITGVASAIMGLKIIQLFPGLPVAPGHKNVILIPLLLLAVESGSHRFTGLITGTTVGILNFMLGYGKFGIFEMMQFMLPGLLADLLYPFCRQRIFFFRFTMLTAIGVVLGLTRFSANIAVIILAGAPVATIAAYSPMLISQMFFGGVSSLLSLLILRDPARTSSPNPVGQFAEKYDNLTSGKQSED